MKGRRNEVARGDIRRLPPRRVHSSRALCRSAQSEHPDPGAAQAEGGVRRLLAVFRYRSRFTGWWRGNVASALEAVLNLKANLVTPITPGRLGEMFGFSF